jgi:catechol 2,3-dioxygenase-like lactoylglutathione lyase family enzyme
VSPHPPHPPHPLQPTPTFCSVAPRFVVPDLGRALAFYEQLGFRTGYRDDGFAIVKRDGVELHFNQDPDLATGRHFVCYITVTGSEALYQDYLQNLPSGRIRGQLTATPYGMQEFWLCDPFDNILIFAEPIAAHDGDDHEWASSCPSPSSNHGGVRLCR